MNTETYEIYETPEAIAAAEARDEPLIYGTPEVLEEVRDRLRTAFKLNRAERRYAARVKARKARKQAR